MEYLGEPVHHSRAHHYHNPIEVIGKIVWAVAKFAWSIFKAILGLPVYTINYVSSNYPRRVYVQPFNSHLSVPIQPGLSHHNNVEVYSTKPSRKPIYQGQAPVPETYILPAQTMKFKRGCQPPTTTNHRVENVGKRSFTQQGPATTHTRPMNVGPQQGSSGPRQPPSSGRAPIRN